MHRLRVLDAGRVTLRVRVVNPSDDPVVTVALQVGEQVERRVLATDSTRGAVYETEWTVAVPGATSAAVPLTGRLGSITMTVGFGATTDAAAKAVARQVIPYRVDAGTAELLLPSQGARAGFPNGKPGWIEVRSLRELTVSASRAG